jgi:c-di-GMP-binding flagellar brake protein YcgR
MTMERRKAQRFRGEIYFTFRRGPVFLKKESPIISVKDISQVGLSFIYPEPFSFDEKLDIKLYLPMYSKPVKAKARAKESERLADGQYKIGLEFIKLSPDVQKNLEPRIYLSHQARAKEE